MEKRRPNSAQTKRKAPVTKATHEAKAPPAKHANEAKRARKQRTQRTAAAAGATSHLGDSQTLSAEDERRVRNLIAMWEFIAAKLHALREWQKIWLDMLFDPAERRNAALELANRVFGTEIVAELRASGSDSGALLFVEKQFVEVCKRQLDENQAKINALMRELLPHSRRGPGHIIEKELGVRFTDSPLTDERGVRDSRSERFGSFEVVWRKLQQDPRKLQEALRLTRHEIVSSAHHTSVASIVNYMNAEAAGTEDVEQLRAQALEDVRWSVLLEYPVGHSVDDLEKRFDDALKDPDIEGVLDGKFSRDADDHKAASGPRRAAESVLANILELGVATIGRRTRSARSAESRTAKA